MGDSENNKPKVKIVVDPELAEDVEVVIRCGRTAPGIDRLRAGIEWLAAEELRDNADNTAQRTGSVDNTAQRTGSVGNTAQRTGGANNTAQRTANAAPGVPNPGKYLLLRLGREEHLIDIGRILFFESDSGHVVAHTAGRMYYSDQKLYELEEVLPRTFMRVSKACILNLKAVNRLRRELTGPCCVGFAGCEKNVYVSRMYYKPFREKLDEMRLITDEKK